MEWLFLRGRRIGISQNMNSPWKSREFDCEGETWTVVRHERTESGGSANRGVLPTDQTGLYFHNNDTIRLLAFARSALPSDAKIRAMNGEALCQSLRRARPLL